MLATAALDDREGSVDLVGVGALLTAIGGITASFIALRQQRRSESRTEKGDTRLANREDFLAVTAGLRELARHALDTAERAEKQAADAEAEAGRLRVAVAECHDERQAQQREIAVLRQKVEALEARP